MYQVSSMVKVSSQLFSAFYVAKRYVSLSSTWLLLIITLRLSVDGWT